jgi:cation/acetate symporter
VTGASFVPGEPNAVAIAFFLVFVALALGIAWWAARRTRTTEHFYAAGQRSPAPRTGSRSPATT